MIHFIFLFSFSFLSASIVKAGFDCKQYSAREVYDAVKKRYKYEDMTDHIDWLTECDRNLPKLLNKKDADEYRQVGLDAQANFLIEKARAASFYRDSKTEINDYLKYVEKNNLTSNKVKNGDLVKDLIEMNNEKDFTKPEDCGTVNLKDRFPPVRNQDSIGWCYAFSSADMLGFKTGYPVSAIDIAVNYTSQKKPHSQRSISEGELHKDIQEGYFSEAFDIITTKGICKESDSPSEYFGENKDIADFIKSAENPFNNIYTQNSFLHAVKKKPLCSAKEAPSLKEISKVISYSLPSNIMYNLNNSRCDNKRIKVNKDDYKLTTLSGQRSKIVQSLDEQLNKKQPSLISYNSGFLKNNRAPALHVSLVIGRRFNQNNLKCEYLIRNSWGTDCKKYAKPYSNPENCDQGNIWVAQEVMYQNINGTGFYTN